MLVAAANPCPCGYYGEGDRCTCTPGQRSSYLARLSGPIMDRIDLQVFVNSIPASVLVGAGEKRAERESSAKVAARVQKARALQEQRFQGRGIFTNAEMGTRELGSFCPLSDSCKDLLTRIIDRLGLSARAYTRIIKIARTIADLDGAPDILPEHLSEAASYRFLDRRHVFDL